MNKALKWSMRFFIFSTWVILIIAMIFDFAGRTWWRVAIWVLFLLALLVAYFKFKSIPDWAHALFGFVALLNVFGEIFFEFFYVIPHYDKFLHFFIPVIGVIIFFNLLREKIPNAKKRLLFSCLIVFSLEIVWELIEVLFNLFFEAPLMGVFLKEEGATFFRLGEEVLTPVADTIWDIAMNVIAVILAFIVGSKFIKKKK